MTSLRGVWILEWILSGSRALISCFHNLLFTFKWLIFFSVFFGGNKKKENIRNVVFFARTPHVFFITVMRAVLLESIKLSSKTRTGFVALVSFQGEREKKNPILLIGHGPRGRSCAEPGARGRAGRRVGVQVLRGHFGGRRERPVLRQAVLSRLHAVLLHAGRFEDRRQVSELRTGRGRPEHCHTEQVGSWD